MYLDYVDYVEHRWCVSHQRRVEECPSEWGISPVLQSLFPPRRLRVRITGPEILTYGWLSNDKN